MHWVAAMWLADYIFALTSSCISAPNTVVCLWSAQKLCGGSFISMNENLHASIISPSAMLFIRGHWTLELWKRVLWSDESRFSVWQPNGRVWVSRIGFVPIVKLGGEEIKVWGWLGKGSEILLLLHIKTFWTILCSQLCGNNLGKVLFYSIMTPVHKARSIKTWLDELEVWKNLTGLHRALILTSSSTFWDE